MREIEQREREREIERERERERRERESDDRPTDARRKDFVWIGNKEGKTNVNI